MQTSSWRRARSSGNRALGFLVGCFLLLSGVSMALIVDSGFEPTWVLLLFPAVGVVYAAAGFLAWYRRPSNRMGAVMLLAAIGWVIAGMANTAVEPLVAAGLIVATMPLAFVIHLLHAFPSGRVISWEQRATVAAGYVTSLVLQAPLYLFSSAGPPYDVLVIEPRPKLHEQAERLQKYAGFAVLVLTAVVLVHRWRSAPYGPRRVLAPVLGYGVFAVLYNIVSSNVLDDVFHFDVIKLVTIQLIVLAGVPIAFAFGVLRGGFARTGEIEELGAWLSTEADERADLVSALRRTLGDTSLNLAFWIPERQKYVDTEGVDVDVPSTAGRSASIPIEIAGEPIGAIIYDPGLNVDPELVRAAGRVIALAVERERLTVQLRSGREALRRTLARVVEAGDRERRRIAQDLHDGLQAQLVLLALEARQLDADGAAGGGGRLGEGLDIAARDLRDLVQGVMPALLIERGLVAAVEDLIDRMPVPTDLDVVAPLDPMPAPVESAAYFVISESLANAVKHAGAVSMGVTIANSDGRLQIEIRDDGVGGARFGGGAGLNGLADRLEVLGGQLSVDSAAGVGTTIRAEVPCAS